MSNDLSSAGLVVCDGSLASFSALMAEALAGGGGGKGAGEKRVVAWTRRGWGERCVRAVARQVELVQSRAEVEHPESSFVTTLMVDEGGGSGGSVGGVDVISEAEAIARAMAQNEMLLAAGAAALRMGLKTEKFDAAGGGTGGGGGAIARLVWPVQLGGGGGGGIGEKLDPQRAELVIQGLSDAADRALLLSRLLAMDSESAFNGRLGAGRFIIQTPYLELSDEQMVELALDMDVPLGEIVPGPGEAEDRWLKVIRAAGAGGLVGGVRGAA